MAEPTLRLTEPNLARGSDRTRVTQAVVDEGSDHWVFETAGTCDVKGNGPTETYLLVSTNQSLARL